MKISKCIVCVCLTSLVILGAPAIVRHSHLESAISHRPLTDSEHPASAFSSSDPEKAAPACGTSSTPEGATDLERQSPTEHEITTGGRDVLEVLSLSMYAAQFLLPLLLCLFLPNRRPATLPIISAVKGTSGVLGLLALLRKALFVFATATTVVKLTTILATVHELGHLVFKPGSAPDTTDTIKPV